MVMFTAQVISVFSVISLNLLVLSELLPLKIEGAVIDSFFAANKKMACAVSCSLAVRTLIFRFLELIDVKVTGEPVDVEFDENRLGAPEPRIGYAPRPRVTPSSEAH